MIFSRCSRVLAGFCMAFALCAGIRPVAAQSVFVPGFFDPSERFERPDLSALKRLRFLTTVDFPPFNYVDRSGYLAGYNIDLMRALCLELKVEKVCQVEALPWNEVVAKVEKGDGEAVIAGLAPTAEDRARLSFSRAYLHFPARFIGLSDAKPTQPFAVYLRSLKVGVVAKTIHQKMLAAYFPDTNVTAFDSYEKLYKGMRSDVINAAFGDGMTFALWLGTKQADHCCKFIGGPYLGTGSLGEGMRIAVSRKNASLAAAFNYALQSLERKGKLAELYLRYFPIGFY